MFVGLHGVQSDEEEGHLSGPAEGLSLQSVTSDPFTIHIYQRKLAVSEASVPLLPLQLFHKSSLDKFICKMVYIYLGEKNLTGIQSVNGSDKRS